MKLPLFSAALVGFTTVASLLPIPLAGAEAGAALQPTASARTNELRSALNGLTQLEKLWPQNPELCFQSVKKAAGDLGEFPDNPDAAAALANLFTNAIQKRFPTNTQVATLVSGSKHDIFLFFMNYEAVKSEKSAWISTARCLGEIRSLIIPNYQNRGTAAPGYGILLKAGVHSSQELTDPALKQRFDLLEKQNAEDMELNKLQRSLRSSDSTLSFFLLHECANRFPASKPDNQDFIEKVTALGRLTEAEKLRAEENRPSSSEINEFVADPIPAVQSVDFKDFKITQKDFENILTNYFEVQEGEWQHGYSHVAFGSRTGHVVLKYGQKINWMVKPGGLAWLEFPNGKKMYLAASKVKGSPK
jgi:hypothetical protein